MKAVLALAKIDGLVQEIRNSIANALELHVSCTNPSICHVVQQRHLVVVAQGPALFPSVLFGLSINLIAEFVLIFQIHNPTYWISMAESHKHLWRISKLSMIMTVSDTVNLLT